MSDEPFLLGVNYWPQKSAMFMWREFDRKAIEEDVAVMGELGISCVRVFLLWEDFQPDANKVTTAMLDRLVDFLEMAAAKKLKVMPVLFTGYMNGLIWLPPWMLLASAAGGPTPVFTLNKVRSNQPKNPYLDPEVMEAQLLLIREVTNALAGHPALFAWDLGNEPSRWAVPGDEFVAGLWLQTMSETLRESDETVPVTLGLNAGILEQNRGLTLKVAARHLDYLAVTIEPHHVTWTQDLAHETVLPFVGCLIQWLVNKPVLLQEFGLPTVPILADLASRDFRKAAEISLINEDDAALFAEKTLAYLRRFQMVGAFWKSFGDYHPSIWNWPPLDRNVPARFCGLLRHDGSPKSIAAAFSASAAADFTLEKTDAWIDIDGVEFLQRPRDHLRRLCHRFRDYYGLV